MGPAIAAGVRKEITELDVAFLNDIGWIAAAVPEPGTASFLLLGAMVGFARRRRASIVS
ncbi:MAG: hypothetical protein ACI9R3_003613 [Verrucomicrobiales bacterium]|jgi:hypothetical protein